MTSVALRSGDGRRILIAGAGAAGVAAAAGLRAAGFAGRVLIVNAEPDPPYTRPPLSKEVLAGAMAEPPPLRSPEWYVEHDVELATGARILAVDPAAGRAEIETPDGEVRREGFDGLLLATGARARSFAHPPGLPVFTLRALQDLRAIAPAWAQARRVIIVGGGVIGLEAAAVARAGGREVTVVEAATSVMRRALPPPAARVIEAHHGSLGVRFRLGTAIAEIARHESGVGVVLTDGERLVGDLVLVAIGVTPRTELAQAAGCEIADGVVVDAEGRTRVEGVFAAGDVASFPHRTSGRHVRVEAWQHAGRHGEHVGRVMAGLRAPYDETPWFWSDQGDLNLQVVGLAADSDRTVWRGEGAARTALHFVADRLVAATTFNNGRDIRPLTRLIAAGWRGDPRELADDTLNLAGFAKTAAAAAERKSTGETTPWLT